MRKFFGVLALSLSAAAVAYANPSLPTPPDVPPSQSTAQQWDNFWDSLEAEFGSWIDPIEGAFWSALGLTDPDQGQGTVAAPEFDPAAAMAAMSLLAGGLAVLRGRRAKR